MLIAVNNEKVERAVWMPDGDMPAIVNEVVTFHEPLRAP